MTNHVNDRVLPEYLIDVPAYESISIYNGRLGNLAVTFTQIEGLRPYLYDEGIIYRDVLLNGEKIGDYDLLYDYEKRKIGVTQIDLVAHRNEGLGKALYRSAILLPLPSGERPRDKGFFVESLHGSDLAKLTWESLVRSGDAVRGTKTDRHFIMR